ncbi:hypothetical protein C8R43DRAFT_1092948 [Mycena crocata]|nr:hypothetical protein C8R43DRAFT_1092948 [Mycena crocata]
MASPNLAVPGLMSAPRLTTLLGSMIVVLGPGTIYYIPHNSPHTSINLNHTQLNTIGLATSAGSYLSGPFCGRLIDMRGPRILFAIAFIFLSFGYAGIRHFYDAGVPAVSNLSGSSMSLLLVCSFITGAGGKCGFAASRATTIGLVAAGYGPSALVFTMLAQLLFPGNISSLLLLLFCGTTLMATIGFVFVCAVPLPAVGHRVVRSTYKISSGPDIHGRTLFLSTEFWLFGVISAILSGAGVMCESLWLHIWSYLSTMLAQCHSCSVLLAKEDTACDEIEVSRWQAKQVSTLSILNFSGRVVIGLISDNGKTRFGLPRSYAIVPISTLFFSHLSENSGLLMLWLLVGGNIFPIAFGRNLDAHTPGHSTVTAAGTTGAQCLEGHNCYAATFGLTVTACFAAILLSRLLAWRDRRKLTTTNLACRLGTVREEIC